MTAARPAGPERVLVLPRSCVPGGCDFTGVREADTDALVQLHQAVAQHGHFMERPLAEESPDWKQLIPYVLLRDGEDIFLMERTDAGGDPRLHRKATIGVGGHINPVDEGEDPLRVGLAREWREELTADWEPQFELIGMLNDDSNPVGSVHLGIVFSVEAEGRPVAVRETHKLSGRFATPAEVLAAWDRMETWSQLVAAHLLDPRRPAD